AFAVVSWRTTGVDDFARNAPRGLISSRRAGPSTIPDRVPPDSHNPYRGGRMAVPPRITRPLLLVSLFVLVAPSLCRVQTGGSYDLSWSVASAAGGAMSGGAYSHVGTAGQSLTNAATAVSPNPYTVLSGFWSEGSAVVAVPLPGAASYRLRLAFA